MIKYLYADSLDLFPKLAETMFRDRAVQFRDRLGWDVMVDANGHERDQYDAMNPLYVIVQNVDGSHGGSMRFLPTTAETMVNDHFLHLTEGVRIASPLIWECTRFCLSPANTANAHIISGGLMMAGCELGLRFGLKHAVGVFDARMSRIYRRLGWAPDILGTEGQGNLAISVGLWAFSAQAMANVAHSTGLNADAASVWFDASFPIDEKAMVA